MAEQRSFGFESEDERRRREVYGGAVPRHRDARPTEARAADRMREVAPSLRMRVLSWVRAAGPAGLTMKEAGARYAIEKGKHESDGSCRYSVAPRMTELSKAGFLVAAEIERDGSVAWVASDKPGDGRVCEETTRKE